MDAAVILLLSNAMVEPSSSPPASLSSLPSPPPDAVVELLSRQQLRLGVVVAADGAGDPGEVLEALLPLGHLVVRAAQLGHLDFFWFEYFIAASV